MYKNSVTVNIKNGVHMRIAAMIVHKTAELKSLYGVNLYIRKITTRDSLAISMLALMSLRIVEREIVEISCKEEGISAQKAVLELSDFISKGFEGTNASMSTIDDIIEENRIAHEQILENIPVGIVVIDTNSHVTTMNQYALKFIHKNIKDVLGRSIMDILPTFDLSSILLSSNKDLGKIQHIDTHIVISNRSPIFSKNKVIGAIGVFQDISELVGMKELNEQFKKILECSHDLICFVDENKKINYVNPAYENHFSIQNKDLIGKDLLSISPTGLRSKVFETKGKIENIVHQKDGIDIVSTIEPIFIDEQFKGVLSISKSINDIKRMMAQLEKSEEELNYYKEELKKHTNLNQSFEGILGNSGSLTDVLYMAHKAAKSSSTVLIRGESGTGKELLAKAIHNNSQRKDQVFLRVNCAAIPENLLESELFGYEKGAFTGAVKSKPGKFNLANGGSLFLDEIGDMPLSMQVKLLRVLQEMEFESVGGIVTQKVDVRIIAATNRNLEEMLLTGAFREDLYYRLNVIPLSLPPLRNRKEDINLLVEHFILKIGEKLKKEIQGIDPEGLLYLQEYHWPGNIRELENIIERAITLCDHDWISVGDLPFYITNLVPKKENLIYLKDGEILTLEAYEKEIISLAIKKYKSFNKTAKALGVTHRTISLKCKKYGIEP